MAVTWINKVVILRDRVCLVALNLFPIQVSLLHMMFTPVRRLIPTLNGSGRLICDTQRDRQAGINHIVGKLMILFLERNGFVEVEGRVVGAPLQEWSPLEGE